MNFDWHLFWNGAPAWIQAIGSILALVAVILASKIPVNHAASEKRRTIFAIVEAAHSHACNIRKAIDAMGWPTGNNHLIYQVYNKVIIEGVVRALQGAPIHELGSSKAVLAMLSLTDQMVFLGSAVEALLNGPLNHPELKKGLESIDQNDHALLLELGAVGFSVLQSNSRGHLDQIDKEYVLLKESLKS